MKRLIILLLVLAFVLSIGGLAIANPAAEEGILTVQLKSQALEAWGATLDAMKKKYDADVKAWDMLCEKNEQAYQSALKKALKDWEDACAANEKAYQKLLTAWKKACDAIDWLYDHDPAVKIAKKLGLKLPPKPPYPPKPKKLPDPPKPEKLPDPQLVEPKKLPNPPKPPAPVYPPAPPVPLGGVIITVSKIDPGSVPASKPTNFLGHVDFSLEPGTYFVSCPIAVGLKQKPVSLGAKTLVTFIVP